MNIHSLIFSNKQSYRISRHAIFWLLWILYYAVMTTIIMRNDWGVFKRFFESFTVVALSTPLDMCFCYFIIYFLFPKFLYKGRYTGMLLLWLLASIIFIFLFELNSSFVVPFIRGWFVGKETVHVDDPNYAYDFFVLFSQINMEGCVASSIKLGKLWYVKQQEIDLIKQEKLKIIASEEKGELQPAFLINLLGRMETIAGKQPGIVVQSLQKIRKLLTYILYENATSKVPLSKEIVLLQEYIDLEKLTAEKNIIVTVSVQATPAYETIAPYILLPVVENAFKQLNSYPLSEASLNIKVTYHNGILYLQLQWDKPIETSSLTNGRNVILQNISKRLQLIYPQSHDIKMTISAKKILFNLSINLKKAIN